tara:strand:+ start:178 stop:636 length:459 start_codon:yes stop_codon:yes gene_type:complete
MHKYIKKYDLSKVDSIPWDVYVYCRDNNFSTGLVTDDQFDDDSYLKYMLENCLDVGHGNLYVAHNRFKHIGWGLVYKLTTMAPDVERKGFVHEFQCYVPPRMRRKGIGSKILQKAIGDVGPVKVFAHQTSIDFYKSNGLTPKEGITGKKLKI